VSYAETHADALATVTEAGAAAAFTMTLPGTYDPSTDTWSSPSTSTVSGYAVQVKGNPIRYEALGLTQGEAATLLFTPTTYAQVPALGSKVTWNSTTYTVRDVTNVAPDGSAILSPAVVVAR